MKKTLLVFAAAAFALHAEPVPFATVEISSFDQLQADATAVGTVVGQPMLPMALVGAGNFLGSPGMLGIDRTKPIRLVFATENDVLGNQPVFILPLSEADGAGYLNSLATMADKVAGENGFSTYRFKQFPRSARFRVVGGYAVFANEGSASDAFLARITDNLAKDPAAYTVRGLAGTVRAEVSASYIIPTIERAIRTRLESIEDDEARSNARTASTTLTDLLRGASRIALGLECSVNTGLSIWSRVDALPDSKLQGVFAKSHVPSDALLPYVGGAPEIVNADGYSSYLVNVLLPLLDAVPGLLSQSQDPNVQNQATALAPVIALYKEQAAYLPDSSASFLRYDDKGRPFIGFVTEGGDAEAYCKKYVELMQTASTLPGQENGGFRYGEPTTRTAQGLTIQVVPVSMAPAEGDAASAAFADYLKENGFCYELVARDGHAYCAIGPSGSLESLLEAPAPAPCAPLAEAFPDMKNIDDACARFSMDFATLAHDIAVFMNGKMQDESQKLPATVIEKLARDPGRIAGLTIIKDSTSVGVLRITPGFFRVAQDIVQTVQEMRRAAVEAALNSELEGNEGLEDLTDEDLDKLLDEADTGDGKQ